jgi:glycogen operon protein
MLLAGDELGHTQNGNNNTYCQDNELTWLNSNMTPENKSFLEFVKKVVRVWKGQPVFQRRHFFQGRAIRGSDIKDISWLGPDGKEMPDEAWDAGFTKCLGMRLAGDIIGEVDERGKPIVGDTLLVLLNAHWEPIPFTLPLHKEGQAWELVFDTARPEAQPGVASEEEPYQLRDRSVVVMRIQSAPEGPSVVVSPAQVETLLRPDARTPAIATTPTMG